MVHWKGDIYVLNLHAWERHWLNRSYVSLFISNYVPSSHESLTRHRNTQSCQLRSHMNHSPDTGTPNLVSWEVTWITHQTQEHPILSAEKSHDLIKLVSYVGLIHVLIAFRAKDDREHSIVNTRRKRQERLTRRTNHTSNHDWLKGKVYWVLILPGEESFHHNYGSVNWLAVIPDRFCVF